MHKDISPMFAKLKKLITISRSLFIYNDPERSRSRPLRGFRKRVRLGESRRRPAMHRLSPNSSGIGQDLHSRRFAMRRRRHSRVRARVSEDKNIRTTASRPAVRTSAIISNRGEGGIRTRDTLLRYTHFPGVLLRPLGHFSLTDPSGGLAPRGTKRAARYENS